MSVINTTLKSFCYVSMFQEVFSAFPHDYEFDENAVLRRIPRPCCPRCGTPMSKNGYNSYTKKGLGILRIGRWSHKECNVHLEEDRTFWENLKEEFFGILANISQVLRTQHVSYEGMSQVFSFIYPRSKESVRRLFVGSVELVEFPEVKDIWIVHYDEQHPKKGRAQQYRLTLVKGSTGEIIADDLFDDKSPGTIKAFLAKYLDPTKPVLVVTDFFTTYPAIFEEFFVNGFYHQKCLLHLNKLIAKEFSRNCSMKDELLKYELLNIFYDRSREIKYLKRRVRKEERMRETSGYREWLKRTKRAFYGFLRKGENQRRRKKMNLKLRSHRGSVRMFNQLMKKYEILPKNIQKRLRMIATNWKHLTMFHHFEGAPATNNVIENYFSASLKSHHKRQYTSKRGITNQMKLARMKRLGMLRNNGKTVIELFRRFAPFSVDPG